MKYGWWLLQILMTVVCGFFFIFGIDLLLGAYSLNDPYSFIMTFFAASFVILISLALFISFIIKMVRVFRQIRNKPDNQKQDKET